MRLLRSARNDKTMSGHVIARNEVTKQSHICRILQVLLPVYFLLILVFCAMPFTANALSIGNTVSDDAARLKVAAESVMTQANNVTASSDVDHIWNYVDHLWANDQQIEAKQYIEAGLSLAPFNYKYQAKLALILAKQGNNAEAFDRASIVYQKSEDPATVKLILGLLGKDDAAPFKPVEKIEFASPTVVLLTIGDINPLLVKELQHKISDFSGLATVVLSGPQVLPPPDRSYFKSEIKRMRGTILAMPEVSAYLATSKIDAAELRTNDEMFVQTMIKFLEQSNQAAADSFGKNMQLAKLRAQQWKYDTLRDYIIEKVKNFRSQNWLLVGVTECDLFMEDSNYVFAGTNPHAQAIISYKRFMGDFNNEPQNRKRLLARLFKQFLSVFGFLNGMIRCTFPDCARVFPRTLAEHDEKPEHLCNDCRQTLDKLLKISIQKPEKQR
jgi:predicted Zn-dependent protease